MCVDAIIDLTHRGDIVLDPFLGSGSTLVAAGSVGRRCFGIELDPRYVDVAVARYQSQVGGAVSLQATGETFEAVATSAPEIANSITPHQSRIATAV